MSVVKDFPLPDLGEGLTESDLIAWRVGVGDTVELNQVIAEVETAKALVEVPSPFAGTVTRLYAEPGATVKVGAPLVAFELDDAAGAAGITDAPGQPARQEMLVGRGPAVETGERPHRRGRGAPATSGAVAGPAVPDAPSAAPRERPRSTPPVRALARELGVELAGLDGTGPDGLITREDVRAAAAPAETASGAPASAMPQSAAPGPRADRPRETRTPIAGVRKRTAQAMVASAFGAPQVTEFVTIDVTRSLRLIAELSASSEFRGRRLTLTSVVGRALMVALRRTPEVNARWDAENGEIVTFGYVNLGIAVASARGLTVPNVKDADRLTLAELADAVAGLVSRAREGSTTPAELTGGTVSITNVGVFGVDAGTPLLNPGEAAILAMGAVQRRPWEHHGKVALRDTMTLALTFDHRLVDGEQGSRVLRDSGRILQRPSLALAWA